MSLKRHMGLFVVQRNCMAPPHDAFPHMRGSFATKFPDLPENLR
jgi:hypothetical protein